MAASSLQFIQSLGLSLRNCAFFPLSGFRGNNVNRRNNCCLVLASSKKSDKDLCLQYKVETLLDSVKWDDKGLAVAIAQNIDTGAILMEGFVNKDALATTISSQKATFYSRSRSTLWTLERSREVLDGAHGDIIGTLERSLIHTNTTHPKSCFIVSQSSFLNCFI